MSAPPQTRAAAAAAAGPSAEQIAAIADKYPAGARAVVTAALKSRAKIIVMFAEKGGVGKTTQSGSLAWGLAERGHRVLIYDCDAQRSLSNWLLGSQIDRAPWNQDYDAFVNRQDLHATDNARPRTLFQQLETVRLQTAAQIPAAYPIPVRDNLWLVPGDRLIVEYDAHIAAADALIQIVPGQGNLMALPYHAIIATANLVQAEYVIVDLNPSRGVLNRCLLTCGHFLITPVIADFFSFEMLRDLANAILSWQERMEQLRNSIAAMPPGHRAAITHPSPTHVCLFLGYILSRYKIAPGTTLGTVQNNGLTNDIMGHNEANWAIRVRDAIRNARTKLLAHSPPMAIPDAVYHSVNRIPAIIGQVSEYHQLAALSGHFNRPVAFLQQNHMVTHDANGREWTVRMGNAASVYANVRRFHSITMATVDTIIAIAARMPHTLPF